MPTIGDRTSGSSCSRCSATSASCDGRSPSPISTTSSPARSLLRERAGHGQELLAHRAGRRDEQQQLVAAVGAPAADMDRAAGEIGEVELGRAIADPDRGARGQGAQGRHALVQHADLAGEAQHDQRQADDDDPEQDLRDDQGLHRLSDAPFRLGRAPARTGGRRRRRAGGRRRVAAAMVNQSSRRRATGRPARPPRGRQRRRPARRLRATSGQLIRSLQQAERATAVDVGAAATRD